MMLAGVSQLNPMALAERIAAELGATS